MKKNFFKFLLLGVFTLSLGAVGCKDYDDDINTINEEIAELQKELNAAKLALQDKDTELSGKITQALADVAAAKTTADEAKAKAAAAELAVATAKQQAVAEAKTYVDNAIANLASKTYVDDAIKAALVPVNTKLDALELKLSKVDLDQIAKNKSALETQASVLEKYAKALADNGFGTAATGGDLDAALKLLNSLKTQLAGLTNAEAALKLINDNKTQLETLLANINPLLNVLAINNQITSVTFMASYSNWYYGWLDFYVGTPAPKDATFGGSFPGAVSFKKDKVVYGDSDNILVRVTPATADLSAADLTSFFMNSKGDKSIMDYLTITSIEKFDGLLTRANEETGLWEVNVSLKAGISMADLAKVVKTEANDYILYAFVTGKSDRNVETTYDMSVDVIDLDPLYNDKDGNNLAFAVSAEKDKDGQWANYTSSLNIQNRYDIAGTATENRWAWTGGWNKDEKKEKDPNDNRAGKAWKQVTVGQSFAVKLTNDFGPVENIYKWYVDFDLEQNAVESAPSEWNAWMSYQKAGLKGIQEVKFSNEEIIITLPTQAASNITWDIVGFRVYAVNYNGVLVDPDGKAFYVIVGDPRTSASTVAFTLTPLANPDNTDIKSLVFPSGIDKTLLSFTNSIVYLTIEGHDLPTQLASSLVTPGLALLDKDKKFTNDWTKATQAQFIGVDPTWLKDSGEIYEGTIELRDASASKVLKGMIYISMTKKLPTFTVTGTNKPDYKTDILQTVGSKKVIYAYPYTNAVWPAIATKGTFDMITAFNYITADAVNPNLSMNFRDAGNKTDLVKYGPTTASGSGFEAIAEIQKIENIGLPYLTKETTAPKEFTAYLSQTYEDITNAAKPNEGKDWVVNYTFPTTNLAEVYIQFRSFIGDSKLVWNKAIDTPYLVYNKTPGYTVPMIDIKVDKPAGAEESLAVNPFTGIKVQDRPYSITRFELETVSSKVVNEYFTPSLTKVGPTQDTWTLAFVPVTSQSSAPANAVNLCLYAILKDEFGHEYRLPVGAAAGETGEGYVIMYPNDAAVPVVTP